jgi:long-chain acyl-CoA synthetase
MSIIKHAHATPDKPCFVAPETGESMSFSFLNESSIKLARALRRTLRVGDRVALLMDNGASYYVTAWACRRAGLRFVPVNWHLTFSEAAYIVENSDARALVAAPRLAEIASQIAAHTRTVEVRISDQHGFDNFVPLSDLLASEPPEALPDETEGAFMFYSSGTTGQPKGIMRRLTGQPFGTMLRFEQMLADQYGFTPDTRLYAPAPLYHAAPLGWTMGVQNIGGSAFVPRKFDAEQTLAHIERYKITHAKFVPTHFVRMLQLPESVRRNYDCSSLEMVVHSAAPCPIDVKEQMIEWLGPIVHEYYAMSEGGGFTAIDPANWLKRKGSVGRPLTGAIHILDDDGHEVPPGQIGHICFEAAERFEYHKAPDKTAEFFTDQGWSRPGDMGWIDEEGFLFLADRASHMIISGGVNIYPQEVEAVLGAHSDVFDVAVIGVPDAEFGEAVKAVVQLKPGHTGNAEVATLLINHCRKQLASFKCPRSVDFVDDLPRLPTGKLLKRELRKRYWGDSKAVI